MSFKDKFSEDEWETLQLSVIWMFQAIAGADKNIDEKELHALTTLMNKAQKFEFIFLKELLSSLRFNINEISDIYAIDQRSIKTGLRELAEILKVNFDPHEALLFKKSLLAIGMYIADVSGDLISHNISNKELQTIVELALFMKISINDYRKSPTVEELMIKFLKD
jgi:uncharacterized membrane protein YjdF